MKYKGSLITQAALEFLNEYELAYQSIYAHTSSDAFSEGKLVI